MSDYDGSIKIDTKMETAGLETALNSLEKTINEFSQTFIDSMNKAGKKTKETENDVKTFSEKVKEYFKKLAGSYMGSGFAARDMATLTVQAINKTIAIIKDCTAAYRVQEKAERALEAASKNNPYLNDESVASLKQFASELQKTSEIGDEVSIGLMAQLANAGRTEDEIRQIMQVSADMAASGAFTIDGAVKNLNKTFSGLSGELGEVVPELKNLTAEEMQNGKAIDVLKSKYKGMAEGTAQTTVQLANSFGDLKETIGAGWDKSLEPARKWLKDIIDKVNETISKSREINEAFSKEVKDNNVGELDIRIKSNNDNIKIVEEQIAAQQALYKEKGITEAFVKANFASLAELGIESTEALEASLEKLKAEGKELENRKKQLQDNAKLEADKAAAEAARIAAINAQNEKNKKAEGYLKTYEESLAKQIESIKLKAQLEGRSIESAAVQQEILNAQIGAYMALIESSEGLITGNTEREKEKTKAIEAQTQAVKNLTEAEGQRQKSLDDAIAATEAVRALLEQQPIDIAPEVKIQLDIDAAKEEAVKLRTELRLINDDELAALGMTNEQRLALIEDINKKEAELVAALEKQKGELRKEGTQKERDEIAKRVSMLNNFMQQANQIAEGIQKFATDQINVERDLRIAEIENSTMGEKEKEKAILDIKKDAAEKQYKVDMFAWTASLLATTANIAQGISVALTQKPPMSFISAALVGAAGAVQIASVIASKPRPPSFASGGIVPGSSYSGDRVQANVNSGEMILNAAQQRALWETANGRTRGGSMNVVINNSAANIVSAQPNISKDQIEIMIDARVKASMSKGRYNDSLRSANAGMDGTAYTI